MVSTFSFIDPLDPSRALFYYYFIHGALFPLTKIFLFNAGMSKSATMSPQVTETHVQPSHHVGILVLVPIVDFVALESPPSLIFWEEAWTSVFQRTQISFVEIPLGSCFIKIINYFKVIPKFKLMGN